LRAARERAGISQFSLANRAKRFFQGTALHPSSISQWERGGVPPVSVFLALAHALGVHPRALTVARESVA
jgi:transcriptional regulator with XRE-family HTH domain